MRKNGQSRDQCPSQKHLKQWWPPAFGFPAVIGAFGFEPPAPASLMPPAGSSRARLAAGSAISSSALHGTHVVFSAAARSSSSRANAESIAAAVPSDCVRGRRPAARPAGRAAADAPRSRRRP